MKKNELSDKFIELRARDMSITRVAQELGIARSTAAQWNRDYLHEVRNIKAIRLENIKEQYRLTMEQKLETLAEIGQRVCEELKRRDLSQVSADKLLDMSLKLHHEIEKTLEYAPKLKTESEIEAEKAFSASFDRVLKSV